MTDEPKQITLSRVGKLETAELTANLAAMNQEPLKAPFPWFGGKSQVADLVWGRFGRDVPNYVEPFFGSGAVLLARPGGEGKYEIANDADGFLCNFWRAVAHDPEAVARYADTPVHECDLHARHAWLKPQRETITRRLEGDPDWYDVKIAGWWVWGMCVWIGNAFCAPYSDGPWHVIDGQLIRTSGDSEGVKRQMPDLSSYRGITRKTAVLDWFERLAERLHRLRVCCGDFERVLGPTPTVLKAHTTAVFLDPPYGDNAGREMGLYATDCGSVADRARAWAVEHGDDPRLRIALCGYEGEHDMPDTWECVAWKAQGGYSNQGGENANRHRERIWFSPHCLPQSSDAAGLGI